MKENILKKVVTTVALLAVATSNLAWGSAESKIKDVIDDAADGLKKGIEKCGDKIEDIQNYFHSYDWKGVIQEKAAVGPATVTDIKFNDHHRIVVVKPGERIEGKLKWLLDTDKLKDVKYHRMVLGFKGVGPQTTVSNGFGFFASKENEEKFTLIAPTEPGLYQVRFRPVESLTEDGAKEQWKNDKGEEPCAKSTIGLVYVKA